MSDIYGGSSGGGGGGISELSAEEVADFSESGITLTHTDTEVNNGSVGLGVSVVDGSTATRSPDDSSASRDNGRGLIINPNTELEGVKATVSGNTSGLTKAYLIRASDNTTLDTDTSVSSSGDVAEFSATLSSGTKYYVTADAEGSTYTEGYTSNSSTPVTSDDVDITGNVYSDTTESTTGSTRVFVDVTARVSGGVSSGDCVIEWDQTPDVSEWGYVTWEETLNGESVQIDVELADGTVIETDVKQNYPLAPIDSSKNVRVRVRLSRNDTSNNPTLDSLKRHYRG